MLRQAYSLFNERKIDELLAMMTDDVEWPDVTGDSVLRSKAAIRAYWEGQFAVADPRVAPTEFVPAGDDVVAIVDQQILGLQGETLTPPQVVFHRYTFEGDRVRRMVIIDTLTDVAESGL
jgi:hypothetical protein